MKSNCPRFFISTLLTLTLVWMFSCSGKPGRNEARSADTSSVPAAEKTSVSIVSPNVNEGFKLGDEIKVVLSTENRKADSVIISFDSRRVAVLNGEPWEFTISPEYTGTTGRKPLKVTAYEGRKKPATATRFVIVYSDVAPRRYGYRVVHTYPHDRNAFTQGLFYFNGMLYEGTGQTGSNLREVELTTGKVIRQHNLDGSLFGEGITLYNDKIYQLTWQNKVGFVYERPTFRLINKIYYPTEGWGLTTADDRLIMSDGSNVLYYYEPEMFTVVSRLEVYDNVNMIDSLNELEYIDNEIWANIWMTDQIARIDPQSGKVKGYIDLKGLLGSSDRTETTDVLNGIAYDKAGNRIFVTGKNWPKLFEIKITE
ncbi:MAG TPA: glutaminyl-peptide cyclotransferase [Bacteroidales bacterium]|nr:glutaminyl-peptide cyclotransferase [Bacteroidales bacterium]